MPGGVASGFKHVDKDKVEKRLFQVKGRRNVRVRQVCFPVIAGQKYNFSPKKDSSGHQDNEQRRLFHLGRDQRDFRLHWRQQQAARTLEGHPGRKPDQRSGPRWSAKGQHHRLVQA